MTKLKRSLGRFRQVFFHPRVFLFLLAGTLIIFLTFFTENNAMEIAISGIASVFIGIGVNNFSSFETQLKDEARFKPEISFCIQIMETTSLQLAKITTAAESGKTAPTNTELELLRQFIDLGIQQMKKETFAA